MHPVFENYLQDVLNSAQLTSDDSYEVREELLSHFESLELDKNLSEKETLKMIEKKFGTAKEIGKSISKAKGPLKTYFKREFIKLPKSLTIAACLIFILRWQVLEAHTIAGSSMEPIISQNAFVLVNKIAFLYSQPKVGDIVTYTESNNTSLVQVTGVSDETVTVTKTNPSLSNEERYPKTINIEHLKGRVFLLTPNTKK